MNKRIKELIEQSYKEAVETNDYNGSAYMVREFDEEKFAELLIMDCTDLVQKYMSRWPEDCELTKQIKQHFGVE